MCVCPFLKASARGLRVCVYVWVWVGATQMPSRVPACPWEQTGKFKKFCVPGSLNRGNALKRERERDPCTKDPKIHFPRILESSWLACVPGG